MFSSFLFNNVCSSLRVLSLIAVSSPPMIYCMLFLIEIYHKAIKANAQDLSIIYFLHEKKKNKNNNKTRVILMSYCVCKANLLYVHVYKDYYHQKTKNKNNRTKILDQLMIY